VLDLNEFTEESIADAAEGFASEQINAYLEAKKSISSFREEIKSIAESIYGQQSMLPLVFIIASFQFRVGKLDLSRYGIGYD